MGGPFIPSSNTYTLVNNGTGSLNWTASKTYDWITLSATGGTLISGATENVQVFFNANTDALSAGTYMDSIIFTNVGSGGTRIRDVELTVRGIDSFEWDNISTPQYAFKPFPVTITARDSEGYTVTSFSSTAELSGTKGGGIGSSSIIITECDLRDPDFIEIQNVSSSSVDTTGWVVAISDNYNDINLVNSIYWMLPSSISSGSVLYRTDSSGDNYWGSNIFWNPGSNGWAIIIDDEGNIVDFIAWTWAESDIAGMNTVINGHNITIGSKWSGDGVVYTNDGTIQRLGDEDNDDSTDFSWIYTASKGIQNTGLTVPFIGTNPISITPVVTGNFVSGVWIGDVTVNENGYGVILKADDMAGHTGFSNQFDVLEALTASPVEGMNSSGFEAGPFNPVSKTYTLTNIDPLDPVNWVASKSDDWIVLSATSGTLLSGATDTVDVSIGPAADSLVYNMYVGSVTFANTGSGLSENRNVVLTIWERTGDIEITDTILPADDLDMPFGDVVIDSTRSEQIMITNMDFLKDLVVSNIELRSGYFENFNDGLAQNWSEITDACWEVVAVSNEYRASAGMLDTSMQSTYTGRKWKNCSAEATMRRTGDIYSMAALFVRATDDFDITTTPVTGSAYLVAINGNGSYLIFKYVSGTYFMIQDWTVSPYLNLGTYSNVVKVVIQGTVINVYFNESLAWSGTDSDISNEGHVGLVAYSGSASETIHYFDNVYVEPIGDTAVFRMENLPSMPEIVSPSGSFTFDVVCEPNSLAADTARILIESNDYDESEVDVQLSCTGIPDDLYVSPYEGFDIIGAVGGPFTPSSMEYVLTNTTASPLSWQASKTALWIDLSGTSGTIPAGASDTLEVSLNSNAEVLSAGNYSDSITFTDLTNISTKTRDVSLNVLEVAKIPFLEDFESGALDVFWNSQGTNEYRTEVSSLWEPYAGVNHLIMDDYLSNETYSRNELTLVINLANTEDIFLSFWVKKFAVEEDNGPPVLPVSEGEDFDGVAISADGNLWYEVQGLKSSDGISETYSQFTVNLDDAIDDYGLSYNSTFRIRFNHYDNESADIDGFAFDNIAVDSNPPTPTPTFTPAVTPTPTFTPTPVATPTFSLGIRSEYWRDSQ